MFSNAYAQYAGERADAGQIADSRSINEEKEIKPLIVGQKVPEDFWTKEHLIYSGGDTIRQSLKKYKGKPLVIDFWASWCGSCLNSFSKLETLKNVLGDQCNIILINGKYTKDDYSAVEKSYDTVIERHGTSTIPSIIQDEYLSQLFPHIGIPYVVWITKSGMIQSLTRSQFLTPEAFQHIVN